jgi:hypothetical protein
MPLNALISITKTFICSILLAFSLIAPVSAAAPVSTAALTGSTYTVDQSNASADDSNPGTEALPWKTIQHAASAAIAGDTVYVKPGVYPERITLAHSGSSGRRITFQALPSRSVTMWGFYTIGCDFLTIQGFKIVTDASLTSWTDLYGVFIHSNDVEVIDNEFTNLKSTAITGYWHDPYPQRATVARNTITHSQMGIGITGSNWLVEDNEVNRLYNYGTGDSDYSRFFGNDHIIRHNHFHGTLVAEIGAAHVDCFQTFDNNGEFGHNITFDGNLCSEFHQGLMAEAHYYHNIDHLIFINNVFVHGWAWGLCVQDIPYLTAINNTFADIAYHGIGLAGNSHDGVVKNNIFYDIETSYWFTDTSSIDGDYNLIYNAQQPTRKGVHDLIGVDPAFINPGADDFHLSSTSPAIDAGTGFALVNHDFDQLARPQKNGWDIGAFEYQPALSLSGAAAEASIHLFWQVNVTLPETATWKIVYTPAVGTPSSPVDGIPNAQRTFILSNLTNYAFYTVTLSAENSGITLYSATLRLMPSDHLQYMPLINR